MAAPLYALGGGGKGGFYAIFYFGAALSAVALAAIILFVREPAALKTRRAQRRRDVEAGGSRKAGRPPYRTIFTPAILAFVVIAFTSHYAMGAFDVVWSLWLARLGASKTYISMTWVAFSAPMLLSFLGGMIADRYSRFWLFVIGYALSGVAWVFYGVTTNLTLFVIVNVLEGIAIAFSFPAKQGFLIQVSPRRWIGTVTGVEVTAMQLGGFLGALTAPLLYARVSGQVMALAGIVSLVGLGAMTPILYKTWKQVKGASAKPQGAQ